MKRVSIPMWGVIAIALAFVYMYFRGPRYEGFQDKKGDGQPCSSGDECMSGQCENTAMAGEAPEMKCKGGMAM